MKKIIKRTSLKKAGVFVIITLLIFSLVTIIGIASYSGSVNGVNIILFEDFEEGKFPPDGWTLKQHNLNETWHLNESSHSGFYSASCNYDENYSDIQDEWLITPPLDFTGYRDIILSFWWSCNYYWSVDPYDNFDINVLISLDNGDSWLLLWNESSVGNFTSYEWYNTAFGTYIDLSEYYDETNVLIGFQYYGVDGFTAYLDDITIGSPGKSDLYCQGEVHWENLYPNSFIPVNFTVENIGDHGSLLNWEIIEYPEWGNWNLTLINGSHLTPEAGPILIEAFIDIPDQQDQEFTGNITIVNSENRTDFCTIPVYLKTTTPRIRAVNHLLLHLLFNRSPLLEKLLSLIRVF